MRDEKSVGSKQKAVGRKKRLEIRDDTTSEDSKQNAVGRKHSFWMRDQR